MPRPGHVTCPSLRAHSGGLQDALIKWLSGDYPPHEIVLVRAASAIAVTLFVTRFEGGTHL